MATIYAGPAPQQPSLAAQYQPQQAQQQAQQTQDPLFEALAKYITQGPGSSAVSAAQIQSIIDEHSDHRSYLESIVMPQQGDDIRIWLHHGMATGFVSTNMGALTLQLNAKESGNGPSIRPVINFMGKADGFFPLVIHTFSDCVLHWDNLDSMPASFTIQKVNGSLDNSYKILFRPEVYIPEDKPIAEITLSGTNLVLPDKLVGGTGTLIVAQ